MQETTADHEPLPVVDPDADDVASESLPEWEPVYVPIELDLIFDWA